MLPMSTELRTTDTGEWVCTRWCKKGSREQGLQSVEWGSRERLERWEQLSLETDVELTLEDGTTTTLRELLLWGTSTSLLGKRLDVTCGEWGGTVELGSGELLDRLGWS